MTVRMFIGGLFRSNTTLSRPEGVIAAEAIIPQHYKCSGAQDAYVVERIAELTQANGTEMGPSMVLPVRKGDKVSLSTSYFYTEDAGGETYENVDLFVNEILMALATSGAGVLQLNESTLLDIASGNSQYANAITSLLSSNFDTTNVDKPHAYLVWMLYDNTMKLIPEGSGVKQVENPNQLGTLLRDQIPIVENGYLHAYVSNGSNKAVDFDNFQVTYPRSAAFAMLRNSLLNSSPEMTRDLMRMLNFKRLNLDY